MTPRQAQEFSIAVRAITGADAPLQRHPIHDHVNVMQFSMPNGTSLTFSFWNDETAEGAMRRLAALLYTYRRMWHPYYKVALAD